MRQAGSTERFQFTAREMHKRYIHPSNFHLRSFHGVSVYSTEVPLKAIMKSTRMQSNFLPHCSAYNFVSLASVQCSRCFQVKMVQMLLASFALLRKHGSCHHTISLALSKDFEPSDPCLTKVTANLTRMTLLQAPRKLASTGKRKAADQAALAWHNSPAQPGSKRSSRGCGGRQRSQTLLLPLPLEQLISEKKWKWDHLFSFLK